MRLENAFDAHRQDEPSPAEVTDWRKAVWRWHNGALIARDAAIARDREQIENAKRVKATRAGIDALEESAAAICGNSDDDAADLTVLRNTVRRIAERDPALFADICNAADRAFARNMESVSEFAAHEAMGWIIEDEPSPSNEKARQIVLCWLRSGQSQKEFCKAKDIWPNSLRHALETYCVTLADRLNAASVPMRVEPMRRKNPDIVFGVEKIAAALRTTEKKTLKLIEARKLPVGEIGGEYCASLKMLAPLKLRKRNKPARAYDIPNLSPSAFIPGNVNSAATLCQ